MSGAPFFLRCRENEGGRPNCWDVLPFALRGKTKGKRVVWNIGVAGAQVGNASDGADGTQPSLLLLCDTRCLDQITYISAVEMYVISQNPR